MPGIRVPLVVTAGEAPRRAFRQGLDGLIRLALIDQYSREPEACDLLELRVLGVVHDLGQGRNGIGGLSPVDIAARPPHPPPFGIRRTWGVLYESFPDPQRVFRLALFPCAPPFCA